MRSYPVLAPVSRSYPRARGRLPTCYSPVRRSSTPKGLSARLACVKHAASVRPEPGSNSPLMFMRPPQPESWEDLESRCHPWRVVSCCSWYKSQLTFSLNKQGIVRLFCTKEPFITGTFTSEEVPVTPQFDRGVLRRKSIGETGPSAAPLSTF